ncbi:alginate export family protein [Desulfoluna spongiiphila]|uniref:hypothetical protein n=1 Tax=Desulfoluna spongiiphila TaxID=419481 RepID=UPI00125142F1|nr:hypothetical protein [Desulfoluna spongiiphila]VVS93530.1 hypothetical protein DBB_31020 [Desulfoluna spongiiphila]
MMESMKYLKHLVCGTLCLAMCVTARGTGATEFKVQAELTNQAFYLENTEFNPDANIVDPFTIHTRLRTEVEAKINPYASGVAQVEIGYIPWGNDTLNSVGQGAGGALGTDGVNVETRRLYAKAQIPDTHFFFDIGLQGQLTLPTAAFHSPIFFDDVAALVTRYDRGKEGGLRMLWARPTRDPFKGDNGNIEIGAVDGWFSLGNLTAMPYVMYSDIGKDTTIYMRNFGKRSHPSQGVRFTPTTDADGYWFGLPLSYTPTPNLYLGADLICGTVQSETRHEEAEGYLATLKVQHTIPGKFATVLSGWYGSGNDANADNGIEVLPVLSGPQSRGLKATTLATDADMYNISLVSKTGQGTAGVNLGLKGIPLYKGLLLDIGASYISGTSERGHGMPLYFGWDFAGQNIGFDKGDYALEYTVDMDWWVTNRVRLAFSVGAVDMRLEGEDQSNIATKAAFAMSYYIL